MRGETWILLRGLSREVGHWGPFLPALAAAMPGAPVVPVDLPGTGARLRDRWPATIARAMEMVRADVRSRVTPGAPLVLFGVSLGGMVVMEWAARHPTELAGVVVGASSAADVAPFWRRMRPQGIAALTASAVARRPEDREGRIVRIVSNRRDLWNTTTRSWTQIERERPVSLRTVTAQLAAASRWRAPRSLAVPVLMLVGRHDRLVHPDCTYRLARRFKATVVEHPAAGHDLTTDAQDWAVGELLRFRDRLAPR